MILTPEACPYIMHISKDKAFWRTSYNEQENGSSFNVCGCRVDYEPINNLKNGMREIILLSKAQRIKISSAPKVLHFKSPTFSLVISGIPNTK